MDSPGFGYCICIMHLKKMYKSCLKFNVTVEVLHFCNSLSAYFGKQSYRASVLFDFCT